MGRTVADVSLFFQVLSAQDPFDPASAPLGLRSFPREDAKQLTIGWFEDDGLTPVTPETRQAMGSAVKALEQQGFKLKPFRPQVLEAARKLWSIFFIQCGAMFFAPAIKGREQELSPIFRDFLQAARAEGPLGADSLLYSWAESDRIRGTLLQEMAAFPVLLCPVSAVPAFRHGEREWQIDGQTVGYWDAMRYTQWFNLLAGPAAIVPVGKSLFGLPIGLQIAGRPFEDEVVLTVAAALEREFGYQAPPVLARVQPRS